MIVKVNSSLQLSFDLLIRKLESGDSENVVVSPMSLDAAVAMLAAGCSPSSAAELLEFADCETVDELKSKFAKSLDVATTSSGKDCPRMTHRRIPVSPPDEDCSPVLSPGKYCPKFTTFPIYSPGYSSGQVCPKITDSRIRDSSPVYSPASCPQIPDYETYSPVHPYSVTNPPISPVYPYQFTDRTDKDPKISFVNAAWVDIRTPFLPEYEECLKHVFKIEAATTCDFVNQVLEAVKKINSWADSQTNGLIKNIVTPAEVEWVDGILTNALYFKGFWADRTFNPNFTEERDFYRINGDKVPNVPFMCSFRSLRFASFDEFKVLEIPYQSSSTKKFCMQIILPHEQDGLKTLLEKLEHDGFLDFELEDTLFQDLWIPRFKFSTALGNEDLRFPFLEGGKELELTKMVQKGEDFKFRTKICQKAFIEVDEDGTEAAAVTTFCYAPTSPVYEPRPGIFVADHPFLFIIKEKISGSVLFVGTLLNPLESGS